jgi:hypothetical protein
VTGDYVYLMNLYSARSNKILRVSYSSCLENSVYESASNNAIFKRPNKGMKFPQLVYILANKSRYDSDTNI